MKTNDVRLDVVIKLVTFTSGRRIHALRQVRKLAEQYGETALLQRIDTAIAKDRETRALDNQWTSGKGKPQYGRDVPEIDNWVDQLLTSIRDGLTSYTKGAFTGTTQAAQAEGVLRRVFPNGVQALTSLPYVDQVAAVEVVLKQLRGAFAADMSALGLGAMVDRLGELSVRYRTEVDKGRHQLTFSTVQAARKRGQRSLLEIVAIIIGLYYSHTDADHVAKRAALLAPILEQDRAIRALLSARRAVRDIDPDGAEAVGDADGPDGPDGPEAADGADGADTPDVSDEHADGEQPAVDISA